AAEAILRLPQFPGGTDEVFGLLAGLAHAEQPEQDDAAQRAAEDVHHRQREQDGHAVALTHWRLLQRPLRLSGPRPAKPQGAVTGGSFDCVPVAVPDPPGAHSGPGGRPATRRGASGGRGRPSPGPAGPPLGRGSPSAPSCSPSPPAPALAIGPPRLSPRRPTAAGSAGPPPTSRAGPRAFASPGRRSSRRSRPGAAPAP